MPRLAELLSRSASVVRRVIGAPDYERYVAHVHACHPLAVPMTREEFVREALVRRYGKGAGRCC